MPCAELLATGSTFENQAIRCGPAAYGLQFHPEVTHLMLCRWTMGGREKLAAPGRRIARRRSQDGSSTIMRSRPGSTASSTSGSRRPGPWRSRRGVGCSPLARRNESGGQAGDRASVGTTVIPGFVESGV